MRSVSMLLAAGAIALSSSIAAADDAPDYSRQDSWQSVCGLSQSPVDIVTAQALPGDAAEPQAIRLHATRTPLHVTDNGHAIQVDVKGPDAIIRGRHFSLAQFHFHSASEHTIDGQAYPAEGHFVFKAEDGRLAVVAVMYRPGKANRVADAVLDGLADSHANHPRPIDIAGLLPARKGYYRYLGSLTTPPLDENVEWYVLATPMTLSATQIERLRSRHDHNNRQVQPLNGRPLIRYAG
jgi:carbonic anhydrase